MCGDPIPEEQWELAREGRLKELRLEKAQLKKEIKELKTQIKVQNKSLCIALRLIEVYEKERYATKHP